MIKLNWRSCVVQGGSDEEYSAFERIVEAHHKLLRRDLRICEIGSYLGRSTVLLAQFGSVIAVDLWGDIDAGTEHPEEIGQNLGPFLQAMKKHSLTDRVFPVVATSAFLDDLPYLGFNVIYIDADHHYEPAKLDIQRSERHLAPDGLLICHDYKRQGDNPQVGINLAIDELLLDTGKFVIQEHVKGIVCLVRSNAWTRRTSK